MSSSNQIPSALSRIHPGLQTLIFEKGWKDLSDIQKASIPVVLSGADCIIEAPTAGGKTEAVFFPVLTRASAKKKKSIQILYLAPLRALLNDIELRAEIYAETCGLHSFKWHGDVSQNEKIKEFSNPSQVLLTTPESLEAIILRKAGWTRYFSDLEAIIIDEAHNFASGDRGSHLISLLERLESAVEFNTKLPQRIAITATIGNPEVMLKWLAGKNRKVGQRIKVSGSVEKAKDFQVLFFNEDLDDENNVETLAQYRYLHTLYDLLPKKKSIIFGGSRSNTEVLASSINQLNIKSGTKNPVKIRTHHSAVSKFYREEAENMIKMKDLLRSGIEAIISTSTLELGIDVGELDQVIQIGALSSSSAFLQRVGRTGRRLGRAQNFKGLCLEENDLLLLSAVISLGLRGVSEKINFPTRSFHILAHQIVCLSLQNNGIQSSRVWEILSKVYCFSNISYLGFCELVDYMIQQKYLRLVDGLLIVGEECEKHFLGANWRKLFAVFDGCQMYDVWDSKKHIGTLDEAFVESLELPFFFVLGGIEWEAIKIKPQTKDVFARRTTIGNAPKWVVYYGQEVPYETAKEAGEILFGEDELLFLNQEAKDCILSKREKNKAIKWTNKNWIIFNIKNKIEIWTFAGDRINKTLAKLLNLSNVIVASSNYQKIDVKKKYKDDDINLEPFILGFLEKLKENSKIKIAEMENQIKNEVKIIRFSKFAELLPESLLNESAAERIYDLGGLLSEINSKIIISSN